MRTAAPDPRGSSLPPRRSRPALRGGRVALAVAAAIAPAAALPAKAGADVLVSAPPASVSCVQGITLGVWYQSFSGGPRWVHIAVRTPAGKTVWHKSTNATTTWRYWHYHGTCGRHYRVSYTTAGGSTSNDVLIGR